MMSVVLNSCCEHEKRGKGLRRALNRENTKEKNNVRRKEMRCEIDFSMKS